MSGAGDAPISRRKSFKKSLRESFRRLRKGRSTRRVDKHGGSSPSTEKKGYELYHKRYCYEICLNKVSSYGKPEIF